MTDKGKTVKGQTQRPQDNKRFDKNFDGVDFSDIRKRPSFIKKKNSAEFAPDTSELKYIEKGCS